MLVRFPEVVCELPKLRSLALDRNPFDTMPEAVAEMDGLQELTMVGVPLRIVPFGFGFLKRLERLVFESESIENVPKEVLRSKLSTLQFFLCALYESRATGELVLDRCNLESIPMTMLPQNLTYLSLAENSIIAACPKRWEM